MDRYRDRRSPDRDRARYQPAVDSYVPPTSARSRPRSRSPGQFGGRERSPQRPQADTWRGRPRSPPRGDSRDTYQPREGRPRSPPRREYAPADSRYDDASRPIRDRSPPLKRARESSPSGRTARSPPPSNRERVPSPARDYGRPRSPPRRAQSPPRDNRTNYRPRSRSPRREERVDTYAAKTWRRRSPSPRSARPGGDSGRNSGTNSRRSSPRPAYPRPSAEPYASDAARPAPVASFRSPRPRSPPKREAPPPRPRSPYREDVDQYSGRPRSTDYPVNGNGFPPRDRESDPPPEFRERATPTAPGSYRDQPPPAASPPSGPSGSPYSMSAHNRPGGAYPPTAPSHPRGGYGSHRGRGGYPPGGRDFPGSRRPPLGPSLGSQTYGSGAPPRDPYPLRDPAAPVPRRESSTGFAGGPPPFRGSNNSTSLTYPRTQRFNQALADVPQIKAGGERLPPLHDTTKADKLDEEAARLRKVIDEKEAKKRAGLKEWERLERESSTAQLRSELAEEHLRQLNGEGEGMAAAF